MQKLYINGEWVHPAAAPPGGHTLELINPATEEQIDTLSYASDKDTHAAIAAASAAFRHWSRTTPYARAAILKGAAGYIRENLPILARDMVLESGKPLAEARGEWTVAANLFEWYGEEAKRAY